MVVVLRQNQFYSIGPWAPSVVVKDRPLFTFTDWNANPVLITVESTHYPVKKIHFPTVTVWRPESNKPNCFEFVTKILDYYPFPCFDDL